MQGTLCPRVRQTLQGLQIFGVRRGYAGLIAGEFIHLGPREVGGIIHQAGTMLETSRCEEFKTEAGSLALAA